MIRSASARHVSRIKRPSLAGKGKATSFRLNAVGKVKRLFSRTTKLDKTIKQLEDSQSPIQLSPTADDEDSVVASLGDSNPDETLFEDDTTVITSNKNNHKKGRVEFEIQVETVESEVDHMEQGEDNDNDDVADEEFYDTAAGNDEDWDFVMESHMTPVYSETDLTKIREAISETRTLSLLLTIHFQDRTILTWQKEVKALLFQNLEIETESLDSIYKMNFFDPDAIVYHPQQTILGAIIGLHSVVQTNQRMMAGHSKVVLHNIDRVTAHLQNIKLVVAYQRDAIDMLRLLEPSHF